MGVEGLRCDECEEGFYGLSTDGCQGKLPLFSLFFTIKISLSFVSEEDLLSMIRISPSFIDPNLFKKESEILILSSGCRRAKIYSGYKTNKLILRQNEHAYLLCTQHLFFMADTSRLTSKSMWLSKPWHLF